MCQRRRVGALIWKHWELSEYCGLYASFLESPVRTNPHLLQRDADSRLYTLNSSDTLNIRVYGHVLWVCNSTKFLWFCNKLGLFVHLQAYRWWWTPSLKRCCLFYTLLCSSSYWSLSMPSWGWSSLSAKCIRPAITKAQVCLKEHWVRHTCTWVFTLSC